MRLMYSGPSMELKNLASPTEISYVQSISITKDSELDENIKCKNYPFGHFNSYKDCDDQFIYDEVLKSGLMPFWATENYNTVTKQKYILKRRSFPVFIFSRSYNGSFSILDIAIGTIPSPCYKPCMKSKATINFTEILQCHSYLKWE